MSLMGLVSRVTPVHTAVRNCTRDEGRSFEVGNQVLISSHRKLLLSKAMVVNVAEKSERDFGRYDLDQAASGMEAARSSIWLGRNSLSQAMPQTPGRRRSPPRTAGLPPSPVPPP